MKISRNTHTASSSSHRSSSKPSKSSSSSSSKSSKSSAAPSKPAKSSSSSPSKSVKPSSAPSKPHKPNPVPSNPVPSKPVKKSTNSALLKTVKKDANSSKQVTAGSGKTSSHTVSTGNSVKNVNTAKTGKVSNNNQRASGGVKPVVQPNIAQSTKKNHKKDNNTDKKKRPNNGKESKNITQKNYNIVRSKTSGRGNNYIKPVAKKLYSQQALNGSAINVPSYLVPKAKKGNSTFFDVKPISDYLGRQGKKLIASSIIPLVSALRKAGLKTGKEIGKISFKIGKTSVKIGLKIGKEVKKFGIKIGVESAKFGVLASTEVAKGEIKIVEKLLKVTVKGAGEEVKAYLVNKIGKEAANFLVNTVKEEIKKTGINPEKEITKISEKVQKAIDNGKKKIVDSLDKITNKTEVELAHNSDWYKAWKKDLEINPNKTTSRILDMLSNYEDETYDKKDDGSFRSVVTEGNYDTAVEVFKSFKPKHVKDTDTTYGKGLYGVVDGTVEMSVRRGSESGGATLQIKISGRRKIKIRFR